MPVSFPGQPPMNGGTARTEHLSASYLCLSENAGLPVAGLFIGDLYGNGVTIVPKIRAVMARAVRNRSDHKMRYKRAGMRAKPSSVGGRVTVLPTRAQAQGITNVIGTLSKFNGIGHPKVAWRAVCAERCQHGSEGGQGYP